MYNRGSILTGLALLVLAVTFPFWAALASSSPASPPVLTMPEGVDACVEGTEFMRTSHMNLLDVWRDTVVREGERTYTSSDGRQFEMSLTNTCIECHGSHEEFCIRCHDYVGVHSECWKCHLGAKGAY